MSYTKRNSITSPKQSTHYLVYKSCSIGMLRGWTQLKVHFIIFQSCIQLNYYHSECRVGTILIICLECKTVAGVLSYVPAVQWNPSITDTTGTKHFVLYSEVSFAQGVIVDHAPLTIWPVMLEQDYGPWNQLYWWKIYWYLALRQESRTYLGYIAYRSLILTDVNGGCG